MRLSLVNKIIIIAVLTTVAFGPLLFSTRISRAQSEEETASNNASNVTDALVVGEKTPPKKEVDTWLSKWAKSWLPDPTTFVLGLGESSVYYLIFKPASWIMYVGGMVLDQSVSLSISGKTFREMVNNDSSAVNMGWGLARDIVNLFLIFILLYIAIATILQVSKYGAKELLFTLIVVAFMVNFSLAITKLIVDASNVLATGIYSFFPAGTTGSGAESANISQLMENGLDTRKIMNIKFEEVEKDSDMLVKSILALGFGAITMVVAGFIFFAFGILLLIRMVVLMILMIFSPLAFAAHVLPSTKTYASEWWNNLLNQAFFAPAVLFMLWIVISMINGPDSFIKTALKATGISATGDVDPGTMFSQYGASKPPEDWGNVAFMINFLLIIILLIAALVISKKMGAVGAQTAMAMGDKARMAVQGYAGRVARRAPARLARGFTESEIGKGIARKVPLGGALYRGMERAAKWGKLEEVTQRKTESEAKLGMSLAPAQQAAYLKGLGPRSQETMLNKMSDRQRAQMLEKGGAPAQQTLNTYFSRLESRIGKDAVSEQRAKMINSISNETEKLTQFKTTDEDTQNKIFATMSDKQRAQTWETGGPAIQTIFNNIFSRLQSEIGRDAASEQEAKMGNNMSTETARFDYFKATDNNTQQKMFTGMSARDRVAALKTLPAGIQATLKASLSTEEREKTGKAEKEIQRKEDVTKLTMAATIGADLINALKALKPDEVKDLNEAEMAAALQNPAKTNDIINNLTSAHVLKILDRGDQVMNEFLNALVNLKTATGTTIGSMSELSQELQDRGNFTLAAQVKGNPVLKSHLESRGLPEKTPPPPRPPPPPPSPPPPPPPPPTPKPWESPL